ncbi:MAG: hypothetical protein LBI26_00980 [Holosporales bacterium]|nr:hypothetical protein [Holosporales bacterium]
MSFFSIGKNEIKVLQEQKEVIDRAIEKSDSISEFANVFRLSDVILSKKKKQLQNKIDLLKYQDQSSEFDDDGDCIA